MSDSRIAFRPDSLIASGLITAPAWAAWLSEINQVLTTASLGVGLILGAARVWLVLSQLRQRQKNRK